MTEKLVSIECGRRAAPAERSESDRLCPECGLSWWKWTTYDDDITDHTLTCANCGEVIGMRGEAEGDRDE